MKYILTRLDILLTTLKFWSLISLTSISEYGLLLVSPLYTLQKVNAYAISVCGFFLWNEINLYYNLSTSVIAFILESSSQNVKFLVFFFLFLWGDDAFLWSEGLWESRTKVYWKFYIYNDLTFFFEIMYKVPRYLKSDELLIKVKQIHLLSASSFSFEFKPIIVNVNICALIPLFIMYDIRIFVLYFVLFSDLWLNGLLKAPLGIRGFSYCFRLVILIN